MKQFFLLNLISLLLLASCKKDTLPGQPTQPVPTKPEVAIALKQQYLDGAKVDSAILVWEINGQQKTVKMQLRNDSLIADIKQFQPGAGKLSLEVFSSIKLQLQYKVQWVQQKAITLSHATAVNLAGPASYNDPNWLPRIRLQDVNAHMTVVGLRPEDPYFFVKNVKNNVLELTVARDFWKTTGGPVQVGGAAWRCSTGCKNADGDVYNNTFFSNLPQQIGSKQWNHLEIYVIYTYDIHGGGTVLSLTHDVN